VFRESKLMLGMLCAGLAFMPVCLTSVATGVAPHEFGLAATTAGSSSQDRWVPTPGGWRLASQGHRIPRGHGLSLVAGHVLEVDAAARLSRDLSADTATTDGHGYPGTQNPNWVTWAYWTRPAGHAITADTTTWVVPPPPTTYHGQTIYLFNGIEDTATYVLQAVLQYGPVSGYGGGPYWQTACYLVGGVVWGFSGAIQVNPGDTITGIVDGSRSGYTCEIHINARPQIHMDLVNNDHAPWPEFSVAVEALEAYGVGGCTDYPDVDFTGMTAISLGTHGGHPNPVGWFTINQRTECQQHAVAVSYSNPGGEVDLYYRNPGRASPR